MAPGGRLSLSLSLSRSIFLSLSAAAPPSRSSERDGESWAKEKTDGEREDKRRDTRDAYNYLSFYVREPGRCSRKPGRSFSSFRVHSLIFLTLLPFFSFILLLLSVSATLAASRARFTSFLFFSSFFFLTLSEPSSSHGWRASDASAYERARDEREHERTDGRTRAHAYRKAETKCTRVNERVK